MHLRELVLRNFRRFERAEVEFPDGVVGILGPNGAGKSTLVEAIGWALYGHGAARTNKDAIRRQGADGDVVVALEFTLGDHAYRVVREMKGANLSSQARLVVDGREKVPGGANSHAEVTEYVEQLLGMDREAFFTSVVAKQDELDALSSMTPGQRKEVLMRMLDVDAVDDAIDSIRQDRRDAESRIETLSSQLDDPDELARKRREIREDLQSLQTRMEALEETADEAEARVEQLKERRDDLEEDRASHGEAKTRRDGLREQIEELGQRKAKLETTIQRGERAEAKLDDLGDVEEAYEQVRETFEALDSRREDAAERRQLLERRDDLTAKLDDLDVDPDRGEALEEQLEEVRDELDDVEEEIRRVRSLRERLEGKQDRLTDRRDELRDRLETFDELGPDSPCPTCERPLGEAHPDLVDKTRDELGEVESDLERARTRKGKGDESLTTLRGRRDELADRVDELEDALEAWRDRHSTAQTLQGELDDVEDRRDELGDVAFDEDRYEEVKDELDELETKRSRAIQLRERVERLREAEDELGDVEERLADLQDELEEVEATVEELADAAKRYEEVVDELDEAQERLQQVYEDRADLEGRRSSLQTNKENLLEEEKRQAEARETVRDLKERRDYLVRLAGPRDSGLLPDFRRHLIARVRPALAETASALFTRLTDGRYTDLDLDEEYNLLIRDGDQTHAQERFSGGEVDLANLCLRLAVGRLIAERGGSDSLDVVVLDEVFGSQDRSRRENILRTLDELTGQFRQILVITHIDDVKERLEHVLTVRQEDGRSVVAWEG